MHNTRQPVHSHIMRLFHQKRGQEEVVLPRVFLIAIGLGVVLLTVLYAVLTIGRDEAYNKQLAISAFGLDLQTLQSFGKDINANRDITDGGPYHLTFESGKIYATERGVRTNTFLFTHVPGFFFRGGEFYPETGKKTIGPLVLFKRGQLYGVSRPDAVSKYLLTCDTPEGTPLKSIALDPGKGYDGTTGEEGHTIVSTSTTESKYTMRLARSFVIASGMTVNPTRALDADSPAELEKRQNTAGDALISLHVGSRTDDIDVVKAYYNANNPNSRRLACEVLNGIATELNVPVRPIPVDTAHISSADYKQVLKGKRPAVVLEIGNARKAKSILGETGTLANSISNGVKNYGVA